MLSTKLSQDKLVCGYIREESDRVDYAIPICINQLCFQFFNDIHYFKFEGETLQNFLTTSNEEEWQGKEFEINGIVFQCFIYPNGYYIYDKGKIGFFIKIKSFPDDIHQIIFHGTLCCQETGSFYTDTAVRGNVTEMTSSIHTAQSSFGTHNMMPLSMFKNKNIKKLTFCAQIELLQIIYKLTVNKPILNFKLNVKMKKKINFSWDISNGLLENMKRKQNHHRYYFSEYFDDNNWILRCKPVSTFDLILLQLPPHIVNIYTKLRVKLQYESYDKKWYNIDDYERSFTLPTNWQCLDIGPLINSGKKYVDTMDKTARFPKNRVLLDVEIEIIEIYTGGDCIKVSEENWKHYGIE